MTRPSHFMQHRFAFPIAAGLGLLVSAFLGHLLVRHLGWRFPDASAGAGHTLSEADSALAYALLGCTLLPIAGVIATLMLSTVSTIGNRRVEEVQADTLASRFDA